MIFVDTSAFYALTDGRDAHHAAAAATWRALLEAREPLATTTYIQIELIALLQRRLGVAVMRGALRLFEMVRRHSIDIALHDAAIAMLLAQNRRELSLVDCTSFIFMRRATIARAFAYDRHFREFGFEPLLVGERG